MPKILRSGQGIAVCNRVWMFELRRKTSRLGTLKNEEESEQEEKGCGPGAIVGRPTLPVLSRSDVKLQRL